MSDGVRWENVSQHCKIAIFFIPFLHFATLQIAAFCTWPYFWDFTLSFFALSLSLWWQKGHWKFSHYLINFFVAYKKVRCDKISTNSGLEKNSQSSVFVPKLSWAKIILTDQKKWKFRIFGPLCIDSKLSVEYGIFMANIGSIFHAREASMKWCGNRNQIMPLAPSSS